KAASWPLVSRNARRHSPGMSAASVGEGAKRALDVVLSGVGLVASAPVLAAAATAVAFEDGAPVLFRQERLGLNRKPFMVLKLRTMRDGQPTQVGAWLRTSGLDELPQLLNVWRGEMSLVGPRPLTSEHIHRLGWDKRAYGVRFEVSPGLTGPVQVFGAVSAPDSAGLERAYVRRRGVRTDLAILGATGLMLVAGRDRVHRLLRRGLGAKLEKWKTADASASGET
ncbi:MAG: sugar transferase, partial [Polyangiales bacterium]